MTGVVTMFAVIGAMTWLPRVPPPIESVQYNQWSATATQYAPVHQPPIGPGRPCDAAALSDPHVYLICTDDRLAEDWLAMNQAGYAFRNQVGDDVYFPLMKAEGSAAWTLLRTSCPAPSPASLTAAALLNVEACIEPHIAAGRNRILSKLIQPAAEEALRDIHLHVRLQTALVGLHYLGGPPDGSYGPATRDAIRRFQADHGLTVDGFMTNRTAAVVLGALGTSAPVAAGPSPPTAPQAVPTPAPAEVHQVVKRTETPAMRLLYTGSGSRDVVMLLNIAPDAPNASLTLSGEAAFMTGKAALCQTPQLTSDNLGREATDAWFRAHRVALKVDALPSCTGVFQFHKMDGMMTSTDALERLEPTLFNDLAVGLQSGSVRSFVVLSAANRKATEDQLASARKVTEQAIASNTNGFGYIGFAGDGDTACVISGGDMHAWHDVLETYLTELGRDLGYPFNVAVAATDPDTGYARARRRECRLIVGTPEQLVLVHGASVRDHLDAAYGVVWVSPEQLANSGELLRNKQMEQVQVEEAARQRAEQQQELDAARRRAEGSERAEKTQQLRRTYGANAAALRDAVTGKLVALFKPAIGDKVQNWVAMNFPNVTEQSRRRLLEGWEYVSVDSDTVDYGRSLWDTRSLETTAIRVSLKEKNADIGRYDDVCFLLAFQSDTEFSRIRSPHAFDCTMSGNAAMTEWLTSVGFTSQWNAQ